MFLFLFLFLFLFNTLPRALYPAEARHLASAFCNTFT